MAILLRNQNIKPPTTLRQPVSPCQIALDTPGLGVAFDTGGTQPHLPEADQGFFD